MLFLTWADIVLDMVGTGDKKIFDKFEQIKKTIKDIKDKNLGIGFFNNAGNKRNDTNLTNAEIAIKNNLGIGVLARPFFTTTMDNNAKKYANDVIKKIFEAVGKCDKNVFIRQAEETLQQAKGDLQQSIVDWQTPPNAPSTIAKKGFNDPLRDTDQMLNAVNCKIVKREYD